MSEVSVFDVIGPIMVGPSSSHTAGAVRLGLMAVSYTHLRAHETVLDIVCRLLLEIKKKNTQSARLRSMSTTIINDTILAN